LSSSVSQDRKADEGKAGHHLASGYPTDRRSRCAEQQHHHKNGKLAIMSKGSVWKNLPSGKTVRRNKIGGQSGQWAWLPREALESPAYRALSLSGHRILARIQLEQLYHAGKENGRLPVSEADDGVNRRRQR
jgi:hypothetical protein